MRCRRVKCRSSVEALPQTLDLENPMITREMVDQEDEARQASTK